MNKETRIQKIQDILKQEPTGNEKIVWKDKLESMPVYEISLEYLVYNKHNGRILSKTKSFETQRGEINPETSEGKRLIEKFLWDSRSDKNEKTKKDLEKYGQKRVGIITKDGIIIDGNRRAMLLNQIDKFDYFRAIVLDVTSTQDPIEIEKLETSYQMGEDEKLSYNPIEVYLKTTDLYKKLSKQSEYSEKNKDISAIKKIYDWIGDYKAFSGIKGVEERLEIMKIIDDYLDYLGYNNHYTQLGRIEDQFISLTKWLKIFYGTGSTKADWGYKNGDVDDLKNIAFDYIRANYEGKSFRSIASGQKENHFFGNKQIWYSFKEKHFKNIQPIYDNEDSINIDSPDLEKTLKSRDGNFIAKAKPLLEENLKEHEQLIYNQKHKDEPEKLLKKSIDALVVAKNNKNHQKPEVLDQVEQANQITIDMLQEKSPKRVLRRIYDMIISVKVENEKEDKEELLEYVKNIEKEAYQLEKEIKHLK